MKLFMALLLATAVSAQTPSAALRIVVLEGEDAVNIVQQKTAVRPLVEVRDRNNLPVPGATVTFTVGSGQPAAFAGGAQTLTVTTNAAGQAAAAGYSAGGAGQVQIQVQAVHQGAKAVATITQTNFVTAAAAAAAGAAAAGAGGGAASGAAAGAAAGAGGAGGGLSATTIAVIGAGVAGGAVAVTQTGIIGGGSDDGGGSDEESFDSYRGSFSAPFSFTSVCTGGPISPSTCVFARAMTGTMTIDLKNDLTGGRAYVEGSQTDQSVSGTQGCTLSTRQITFTTPDTTATGGPSGLTFTSSRGEASQRTTVTFNGSHAGGSITGSLTVEMTTQTTTPAGDPCTGRGTATVPITLQKMAR